MSMYMNQNTARNIISDLVAQALESGCFSWAKPWKPSINKDHGIASKTPYKNSNAAVAEIARRVRGYNSKTWLTFPKFISMQKENHNIRMKSGSKAIPIFLWKEVEKKDPKTGQVILDKNGNPETTWIHVAYAVYNADCFENLNIAEPAEPEGMESHQLLTAEAYEAKLLSGYKDHPAIKHDASDEAYYCEADDCVHIQNTRTFTSVERYIGTLAHEFGHSTGIKSRQNRKCFAEYSSDKESHSLEELVAEITACIVCGELGLEGDILENAVAYMASWAPVLRENPSWFSTAWDLAEKAASLVLGENAKEEAA